MNNLYLLWQFNVVMTVVLILLFHKPSQRVAKYIFGIYCAIMDIIIFSGLWVIWASLGIMIWVTVFLRTLIQHIMDWVIPRDKYLKPNIKV